MNIFEEFNVSDVNMVAEEHENLCYAVVTFLDDDVLDALEFKFENRLIPELSNA